MIRGTPQVFGMITRLSDSRRRSLNIIRFLPQTFTMNESRSSSGNMLWGREKVCYLYVDDNSWIQQMCAILYNIFTAYAMVHTTLRTFCRSASLHPWRNVVHACVVDRFATQHRSSRLPFTEIGCRIAPEILAIGDNPTRERVATSPRARSPLSCCHKGIQSK